MKFYATSKISENIRETPEGYLICLGVPIARTGEMVYAAGECPLEPGPDGKVIITRSPTEVFRPETIASFEGKAVTIGHPQDFVDPKNWSTLAKGILQNVRRGKGEQESDLVADFLVTDGAAIELVKSGLREVSCGYEAIYTQTGIGRGFQAEIIGNHCALVTEGRAGSSYAINDHAPKSANGKGSKMKMSDRIKAIFAKAQDEALKVAEDTNTETPEEKKGFVSIDDFKKFGDAVMAKLDGMNKGGAAKDVTSTEQVTEVKAKDDEPAAPAATGLEARLAKLEAAVAKLLGATGDADEEKEEKTDDADSDESCDEDGDDEVTDDEPEMVGDSAENLEDDLAARIEILAPGMKAQGRDSKRRALIAAYATKDGKAVIERFTGGRQPNWKDGKTVDAIFIGASEILKTDRNGELSRTKVQTKDFQTNLGTVKGAMTPEKLNELHEQYWKNNQTAH